MADGFTIEAAPAAATWFEDGEWNEVDLPPRAWLAPGYFLRGSVTLLLGPGGVSKSSLVNAWACALAFGTELRGMRPCKPYRSLVFNAEDDALEQRRRLSAVLTSLGKTPTDLAGMVGRIGPNRVGLLLDRHPKTGELVHTAAWRELELEIDAFGADVVFLDPLAELHGEDENANVALREVIAEFRALAVKHDIALVLVHHSRKGPAAPGDMDAGRGASSIASAARVVLTVMGMTEDEARAFGLPGDARRHYLRVDGAKSNYAAIGEAQWFERHAYTLANGDRVAVPVPWSPPVDVVSLETREAIERDVEAGSPAGPYSLKLSNDARSIRQLLIKHGVTTLPSQKTILVEITQAGFYSAEFTKPGNRNKAQGLRAPSGKPENVIWTDDAAVG